MKKLLTELRNKVLYLRNTEELSAKGEIILLHKLNALEKQFAISGVSKSFCECDFAMVRRDEKTQKAYCFECKKEIQE